MIFLYMLSFIGIFVNTLINQIKKHEKTIYTSSRAINDFECISSND